MEVPQGDSIPQVAINPKKAFPQVICGTVRAEHGGGNRGMTQDFANKGNGDDALDEPARPGVGGTSPRAGPRARNDLLAEGVRPRSKDFRLLTIRSSALDSRANTKKSQAELDFFYLWTGTPPAAG